MFVFKVEEEKRYIFLGMSELLSGPATENLNKELLLHTALSRRRFGSFRMLVDVSSAPIQSPEVISRIQPPEEILEHELDRIAIVVAGSVLSQLQAKRIFNESRTRIFMSLDEAEAWLLES
jgi:hypothetical protein